MSRVKRSVSSKKKHKKIIKQSKGFRGRRKNVLRISKQAVLKSLSYHYRDTRKKKRNFKSLWIKNISLFLEKKNLKFNFFSKNLKDKKVILNKKIIYEILKTKEVSEIFLKKMGC